MKMTRFSKVFFYSLAVIFVIYFLFPLVWLALTAFKAEGDVMTYPITILPVSWHPENFLNSWQAQPFGQFTWNSVIVTIINCLGQMAASSLAAFGFARYEFKGKKILFTLLLATMMLPWDVTVIPQYMQFNLLGWIDTLKPLTIPALFGSAYYIYFMRQFVEGIPNDFHEAAKIDGANEFQVYSRIYLPIMRPALVLVMVQTMITVWNDYLGPLVFLNSRKNYTLALGLANFKGLHSDAVVPTMAISVIMALVPITVFFFAQKQIIEGISGGVKG